MRKKVTIFLLIILIIMAVLSPIVFADNSFSASLTPSSSRVTKGQSFTVSIKLSRLNVDGGIAEVSAVLKYNADVISIESEDDVQGSNNWDVTYNEESHRISFSTSDAITSDMDIGKIKFKVSSSTSVTTTAIQLVSIAAGNADLDERVSTSDITTNIVIGSASTTNTNATMDPTVAPVGTVNAINVPTQSDQPVESDAPVQSQTPGQSQSPVQTPAGKNTTKNDDIPETGAQTYIIPLIAFILTLGIISFVNYRRLTDK